MKESSHVNFEKNQQENLAKTSFMPQMKLTKMQVNNQKKKQKTTKKKKEVWR